MFYQQLITKCYQLNHVKRKKANKKCVFKKKNSNTMCYGVPQYDLQSLFFFNNNKFLQILLNKN